MHTLRAAGGRAAAAASLLALLAGIPTGLVVFVGWPLPHRMPSLGQVQVWLSHPLSDPAVIDILALLLWYLWAQFLRAVLVELRAAHTGATPPRLRGTAGTQQIAAALVTALTIGVTVSTVAAPAALAPALPATVPAVPHPTATPGATSTAPAPADTGPVGARPATRPVGQLTVAVGDTRYTYRVLPGDNLSTIAKAWLGDPDRWPEIWALNRHKNWPQVSGDTRFTDPDLIYPNWILDLPADARPPTDAQPVAPTPPAEPGPVPTCTPPAGAATPATTPPSQTPHPTATNATPAPTPSADDDGLVTAPATPPARAPAAPTPTGSPSPGSAPATAIASPDPAGNPITAKRHSPRGVALPSGSWIDLGLALAIAAAVALVWARRRHRYTRRPPTARPRLNDPDLAPMPRVVTQVRRGLRQPTPQPPTGTTGRDDLDTHARPDAHDVTDVEESADYPATSDDEYDATVGQADDGDQPAAVPVVPALANPISTLWPPAGLGLTGPGAEAAARGFLTAALAAGGLDDPDTRTWVVMPSATAATLLGTAAIRLPDTPRLTVTAGLDEALELLETQTLHRTRLVYRHEVDDVAALRTADPFEEPLPPIMLLADTTGRHERTRIAALLAQGQRLDIHGVLLGPWPDGDTVVVADDGTTSPATGDTPRHGAHPADIGRLAVLDPIETVDLLTTLAESHTGRPQAPAPAETTPGDTPDQPPATTPDTAATASGTRTEPVTADRQDTPPAPATARPHSPVVEHDAAEPPAGARLHEGDHDTSVPDGGQPAPRPGRVDVTILGHPKIVDADPQRSLRAKSLELLVYLAVNDGAASTEAILDDLLPDAPASKATHRLHTYVSDLRTALRHTGGPGSYITHPDQRYVLNPDRITIDLWRMRAAIRDADTTSDRQVRITALRRAVDTYSRPLADGCDYEWIEPYREAVCRQVLDAHLALAAELDGQPTEQVTVLETAIGHNPYAEPLYQAAMRAHAQLGHLDAIRALRRTLTRRLAEIDAEPTNDTITLADQLVAQLQRPGRDTPSRPTSGSGDGTAA